MAYDIIVRFPTKELADEFCGQMSDGFGEGLCDFSFWKPNEQREPGETAMAIIEGGKRVYYVERLFDLG